MKSFSILSLVVFLFLVGTSSAANQSCTTFTLPNFLGIGQCLGTSGNICTGTQGAAQLVINLFNCTIRGITKFNVGTQLALLEDIFTSVLNDVGLGVIANFIYTTCRAFSAILPLFNCNGFQIGNSTSCTTPINLSFPNAFNLGKCVNVNVPLCSPGQVLSPTALSGYFKILTCLVQAALNTNADDIVRQLYCTTLDALIRILGPFGRLLDFVTSQISGVLGTQGCN